MSQSFPGAGPSFWENVIDFILELLIATAAFGALAGVTYLLVRP